MGTSMVYRVLGQPRLQRHPVLEKGKKDKGRRGSAVESTGCSFTGPGSILALTGRPTAVVTPAPGDTILSSKL